ncbi:MAG: carboxypeptidase regulatory-like domain-containing protein, partial [Deltaproteobacteria bacterium]|nr:carboxypeptidase regulatory-like domain-containing protein [Deltaproteobacteria bacterium]
MTLLAQVKVRVSGWARSGASPFLGALTVLLLLAPLGGCTGGGPVENVDAAGSAKTGSDAVGRDNSTTTVNLDAAKADAACVPLTCTSGTSHYCGTIGDGCGGTLECGACPGDQVCGAGGPGICGGGADCTPTFTCEFQGGSYCGTIGDGCNRPLECGDTCPTAGWTCVDNVCVGPASVCTPLTCDTADGGRYCGKISDGCGRALDCGPTCPVAGWTCEDNLCVGAPPACTPLPCETAGGGRYCGEIGDGCGGGLDCGDTCPDDWSCRDNVCVGGASCVRVSCDVEGGGRYCGKIGDGCGGTLDCGDTCPQAGWSCTDNVCTGGASCSKLTCDTAGGGRYCGTIGDGCGGTLDCGDTCPNDWTCTDHVCVGGASCAKLTCAPDGGGNYCGTIGDGCGGTLDCPTTCSTAGWVCSTDHVCVGGPSCAKLTCSPAGGGQYCGAIGDGCGGTLDCPTTCSTAGWVCGADHVCVGGPSCVKVTCDVPGGGRYCGIIGDGCGGTLDCGATCPGGDTCGSSMPNVCGDVGGCTGLCAQVPDCDGDKSKTSISGVVYDPAGALPIYNVVVYVPNGTLDPMPVGPACTSCDSEASGSPITTTLTDARGRFKLTGVPAGSDIPLVVQIGKWRRTFTVGSVKECVDNPVADKTLRLPRTQSEGDMPRIAMVVGFSDGLDCLLRRVGIADAEFTPPGGSGRVHMYTSPKDGTATNFDSSLNGGAAYGKSETLWGSLAEMKKYDMMVMSCESTTNKDLKTAAMHQAVKDYADAGGKIFGSHWQNVWVWAGPSPWNTGVIDFPMKDSGGIANLSGIPDGFGATIDTSFTKGAALADWLVGIGATPTRGQLPINGGEHSMNRALGATTRWIYGRDTTNSSYPDWLIYTSFGTPVEQPATGEPIYCGKVVMTDLHVFTGSGKKPFPGGCDLNKTASAQEKALEFLLFDLS